MKNTIKWALPLLFLSIIASCSFFRSSEQPGQTDQDTVPSDTLTKVIETDTLSEANQDSVSGQ